MSKRLINTIFTTVLMVLVSAGLAAAATKAKPVDPMAYAGSESCKTCHAGHYKSWKNTPHSKMLQKVPRDKDGHVIANNSVVVVPDSAWANQKTTNNAGGPIVQFTLDYIKVAGIEPGFPAPVVYTIGSVHKQRFIVETKKPGDIMGWKILGQEYVKKDESQGDVWQDYGGDKWKSWYVCAGCHATGVKTDTKNWTVKISELNVGCEACHGPAAKHVELKKAKKPGKFTIKDSAGKSVTLPYKGTNGYACSACHNRGWNKYDKTAADGQKVEFIPNYYPWENPDTIPATRYQETGKTLKVAATTVKKSGDGTTKDFSVGESFDTTRVTVKVNGTEVAKSEYSIVEPSVGTEHYKLPIIRFNAAPASGTDNVEIIVYTYEEADAFWGKNINAHSAKHHQEYIDWKKTTHAQMGVTCVSCHAAHDKTGALLAANQVKVNCTKCHAAKASTPSTYPTDTRDNKPYTCVDCHMTGMAKSGVKGDIASHLFKPVLKGQYSNLPPAEKTVELDPANETIFGKDGVFHNGN